MILRLMKSSSEFTKLLLIQFDMLILFGVLLGQRVLQHTDNVSKTLQCPSLPATGAHSCASLIVSTLQGLQNDEAFRLFWENVLQHQPRFRVAAPELER